MATKPKLRAVGPDERAPKQFASIEDAAENGSRLDELIQMRRRIARALDDPNTPARDLAALSRRQLEISRDIEAIQVQEAESDDEGEISGDEAWDSAVV